AQRLSGLARERMQVGERPLDFLEHPVQLLLGNGRIVPQGVEERALAVQFLQEVALEVRPAGDFQDLEDAREARVVRMGGSLAEKKLHPVVQVLEAKERAYTLVQWVFVSDHRTGPGLAGIVADASALSQ